jgi:hypothetical protein
MLTREASSAATRGVPRAAQPAPAASAGPSAMEVDALRTCSHCLLDLARGAEHLALPCGAGEAHAMHCACAWAALSGAGEIVCGALGCAARHPPSACTLHAAGGTRSAALVERRVAGGPSAAASAAFGTGAAAFVAKAAEAPGEQVLVSTHYVDADGQLVPGFSGVIRLGRSNRKLLGALGSLMHHFCLKHDAAVSEPAVPPAFSLNGLRDVALREAAGTFRLVYALATGEAGRPELDALVTGSREYQALGPAFLAWQQLLRLAMQPRPPQLRPPLRPALA